jgi:hypothetical protein
MRVSQPEIGADPDGDNDTVGVKHEVTSSTTGCVRRAARRRGRTTGRAWAAERWFAPIE